MFRRVGFQVSVLSWSAVGFEGNHALSSLSGIGCLPSISSNEIRKRPKLRQARCRSVPPRLSSDSISLWTPCPPDYGRRWLYVGLGCIQLLLSCPFRRLDAFHFLRPAKLRTPFLGYGAPHLSARGTSTLLNNALLSAHFRVGPLAQNSAVRCSGWW
jgi:hypothetical protein